MRVGGVSLGFPFGISRLAAAVALLASVAVSPVLYAQSDGSISGAVADSTGGAVAGATVRIKNAETGAERTLSTDESGRFSASSLAVGSYGITVEKAGFQPISRTGVGLAVGQHEELTFALQLGD